MTRTTFAVTLLVRDEADIIAANLEYYLAQEPALIVVTDNSSRDGTRQILRDYESTGRIHVIDEPALDYRQGDWVTRMARHAYSATGADWVLNVDADEFWVPADRRNSLRATLSTVPPEYDLLRARRHDLRYLRAASDDTPWVTRLVWRDTQTGKDNGRPLGPKIAHRGSATVIVAQGNHRAQGLERESLLPHEPIDILHLPLRSWAQYAHKIDNGGSSYERNTTLPADVGWHWRADYQQLNDGTLHAAYIRRLLSTGALLRGLATRRLRRDTWLQRHLNGLLPRAVHPHLLAESLHRHKRQE